MHGLVVAPIAIGPICRAGRLFLAGRRRSHR